MPLIRKNFKFQALLLSLTLLQAQNTYAKIQVKDLKGVDLLTGELALLNPIHGVVFAESGVLENFHDLELSPDYDEKDARFAIKNLFHRLSTGEFVPSGLSKIAHYLHPDKPTIQPPP